MGDGARARAPEPVEKAGRDAADERHATHDARDDATHGASDETSVDEIANVARTRRC